MSDQTPTLDGAVEELATARKMPDKLRRYMLRMQGGKLYLPAAFRLVWFRDECPDWSVETCLIEGGQADGYATVRATITNPEGRVISTAMKTETKADFPAGWVEKAETGSIARALAIAGYGTQWAEEFDPKDEDKRPADSPQAPGGNGTGVQPAEVWPGPGLCPRCYAPEGKRHAKGCRQADTLLEVPATTHSAQAAGR